MKVLKTDIYARHVFALLYKIVVLLALYTICRVLFYLFNHSYFPAERSWDILKVFIFGIRFDFAAIIQYNLLFILLYILPFPFISRKPYQRVLFTLFWIVNAFLLLTNFGDFEYFKYVNKRSTAGIFRYIAISSDTVDLLPQFLRDFWYILLLWVVTVFSGIWLTRKKITDSLSFSRKQRVIAIFTTFLLPAFLFAGARGLNMKPLRIISASRYTDSQKIPLLLNTPFTILHTFQEKEVKKLEYFSKEECSQLFSPYKEYKNNTKNPKNVVILILESFSHEFIGSLSGKKTYTPFLDSLFRQSLLFSNGFANCRQSIEAIPAILASIPSLSDNTYISSEFASNRLEALPFLLKKQGYTTAFFHGGKNGTMGFDEFSKVAGIKYYFGKNEYKGPEAFDGNWGIFDEEFLQFTANKLNELPTPFMCAVFTLSSHHPYKVPSKYNSIIPLDEAPQLRSIQYADHALRDFFAYASKQVWYKNTIFVISADHTAKVVDEDYNNNVGVFRIPIAFYQPGDASLKGIRTDIAQQVDIMPTLLSYLGYNGKFLSYGRNLLTPDNTPSSVSYLGGIYYYFRNGYILSFDGERSIALCNYTYDPKLQNNLISTRQDTLQSMEKSLKAIIQDYNYRLTNNKLYNP